MTGKGWTARGFCSLLLNVRVCRFVALIRLGWLAVLMVGILMLSCSWRPASWTCPSSRYPPTDPAAMSESYSGITVDFQGWLTQAINTVRSFSSRLTSGGATGR
jgi:hypothetical protein